MSGQIRNPAILNPGKEFFYPLNTKLGGPQNR